MIPSGRVVDKLFFTGIYLAVALLVVWAAGRMVNYSVDASFYRSFMMPWESGLIQMRYKTIQWPSYRKDRPVAYMQSVVQLMKMNGIQLPRSNTKHAFTYRLNKFGGKAVQILLVFNNNTVIIYGMPMTTFDRLDKFIDGQAGVHSGAFSGQRGSDQISMIGFWKI